MAAKGFQDTPMVAEAVYNYSVFTKTEKWCIISMVSYAAWFSTLSSFIYFPAVHLLSEDLSVSVDKINLTITSYMAVAMIAPTLVGDAADVLGRRPVYMVTLSLYVVSNIAIASSKSYSALLGLRVLQALAISGTFSIAYGVITDVASPAERGSFVSAVSFAITIAPSIGPILGGSLSYAAGWTWIFWFLSIAAGLCLTIMVLFLPETSRRIVGNGSIRPPKHLRLPVPKLMRHWEASDQVVKQKRRMPNPLKSLTILIRKDNAVIIFGCGLLYVVYTCINASLSVLFIDIYNLNQWQAGIIYLPFGLGGMVSTFFSGPLLDTAYRKARVKRGLSTDKVVGDDLDDFPIEKARLSVIWIPLIVTTASIVAFGWTLHYHHHIAIPLSLQFVAGLCMQLDFSVYNTLLVDKNHRTPAAAQASSNIVRCTFAAITISFLQNLIDAISIGWTFTFMGGLCLVVAALFLVDYQVGTRWRQRSIDSDLRIAT
ncbi:multidrug resistance protein [Hypoxylon trugodes]|uniref:multidrug resistance protein n=1 Tax=Hypoxylon trugodes TaxID=326681 RepID=UPI002190D15E|nr:multidrug resistance protein [Hypoxylon trugodes]KAI1391443.1 multidrug resistance protein [Hypoxylon trugodes]